LIGVGTHVSRSKTIGFSSDPRSYSSPGVALLDI
jgi:hypothetical protein